MICSVYRGFKKPDSYIFIRKASGAKDDFSCIPDPLLAIVGKLELAMQLNINESTKLALADAQDVLLEIEDKGFYLQLNDTLSFLQPNSNSKL
jgi:uncharacterized protein YcgL (UPF0745 family)